mmetsp:Transcript_48296/g.115066  ORF Transcript_48296/g.115066 Transcript_48296/m.115066 type:complete len:236 (-) Transcript_48296:106-813(-)
MFAQLVNDVLREVVRRRKAAWDESKTTDIDVLVEELRSTNSQCIAQVDAACIHWRPSRILLRDGCAKDAGSKLVEGRLLFEVHLQSVHGDLPAPLKVFDGGGAAGVSYSQVGVCHVKEEELRHALWRQQLGQEHRQESEACTQVNDTGLRGRGWQGIDPSPHFLNDRSAFVQLFEHTWHLVGGTLANLDDAAPGFQVKALVPTPQNLDHLCAEIWKEARYGQQAELLCQPFGAPA